MPRCQSWTRVRVASKLALMPPLPPRMNPDPPSVVGAPGTLHFRRNFHGAQSANQNETLPVKSRLLAGRGFSSDLYSPSDDVIRVPCCLRKQLRSWNAAARRAETDRSGATLAANSILSQG